MASSIQPIPTATRHGIAQDVPVLGWRKGDIIRYNAELPHPYSLHRKLAADEEFIRNALIEVGQPAPLEEGATAASSSDGAKVIPLGLRLLK